MKKMAMLVTSIASSCCAHVVQAESTLRIYGVVDNGIEYQNAGSGSTVHAVSGGLFATVWGLQGSEDMGEGLHANFQLEQGFSSENGKAMNSSAAFNRLAWVGMSGSWGEFRLGRQKKPEYQLLNGVMDPLAAKSLASPMNNFNSAAVRSNNAIAYFTPKYRGLQGQTMMGLRDETTKPQSGVQFYNVALRYDYGPLKLGLGYEQQDNADDSSRQRIFRVGGSYRVGDASLYLSYQSQRQSDNSENTDIYGASAAYEFSVADELAIMYGYARDKTGNGNNAQQLGAAYLHSLSKRIILYAAAGVMDNHNEAQYNLSGTENSGVPVDPGALARGVIVGMTYKF